MLIVQDIDKTSINLVLVLLFNISCLNKKPNKLIKFIVSCGDYQSVADCAMFYLLLYFLPSDD